MHLNDRRHGSEAEAARAGYRTRSSLSKVARRSQMWSMPSRRKHRSPHGRSRCVRRPSATGRRPQDFERLVLERTWAMSHAITRLSIATWSKLWTVCREPGLRSDETLRHSRSRDHETVAPTSQRDLLLETGRPPRLAELPVHGVVVRPLLGVGGEPVVGLVARRCRYSGCSSSRSAVARDATSDLGGLTPRAAILMTVRSDLVHVPAVEGDSQSMMSCCACVGVRRFPSGTMPSTAASGDRLSLYSRR